MADGTSLFSSVFLPGTVTSTLFSGNLTNFTGYQGFAVKNNSNNNALEVSTNGVVGFFGSECFFSMGDRTLGGGYGNVYTGGFYKNNGIFNLWNNRLGNNSFSLADNSDVFSGINGYGAYSADAYTSTIPARFIVDPTRFVSGTITDNFDGTVTTSDANVLQIGDIIYCPDIGIYVNVTGIEDSFTYDVDSDLGGAADNSFQVLRGDFFRVTNGFIASVILGANKNGAYASALAIGTSVATNPLTIATNGGSGIDTIVVNQTNSGAGNYYSNLTFYNTNGLIANFSALGAGYNIPAIWGPNDFVLLGGQGINSVNMLFLTNTNGALKFGTGGYATSNERMRITSAGNIQFFKQVEKYNSIATEGLGVPAIYKANRITAQTAAATVATYTTPAADGSYEVSTNVLVTTATLHNFTVTCTYTDEGNTSRTVTMPFSVLAGTFVTAITNASGAVPYEGLSLHIRCKASTSITVATTGTFTTVTYNAEGIIKQLA